jgi:hypothetical protein
MEKLTLAKALIGLFLLWFLLLYKPKYRLLMLELLELLKERTPRFLS